LSCILVTVGLQTYVDMNFFSYFDVGSMPPQFVILF